jgi:hypothetical protein
VQLQIFVVAAIVLLNNVIALSPSLLVPAFRAVLETIGRCKNAGIYMLVIYTMYRLDIEVTVENYRLHHANVLK